MLKLFRSQTTSSQIILNNYDFNEKPLKYCEAVFNLKNYHLSNVRAIIPTEEMMPDEDKIITKFSDVSEILKKGRELSMCLFSGKYENEDVDICVDFDSHLLNICSKKAEVIDVLKNAIEESI